MLIPSTKNRGPINHRGQRKQAESAHSGHVSCAASRDTRCMTSHSTPLVGAELDTKSMSAGVDGYRGASATVRPRVPIRCQLKREMWCARPELNWRPPLRSLSGTGNTGRYRQTCSQWALSVFDRI
jgi:hypothetical protein